MVHIQYTKNDEHRNTTIMSMMRNENIPARHGNHQMNTWLIISAALKIKPGLHNVE